jgi:hypothetical protein
MALVTLAASGATGQSVMPAEELYADYFGCWTCHGPRGQGGDGQPLRETYLPLSMYMKTLRLPAGEMPPFSDILATDEELAAVYAWLEGIDPVAQPLPVELTLTVAEEGWSGGEGTVLLEMTPTGEVSRSRLRLTIMDRDDTLLADRTVEVEAGGEEEALSLRTDRYGQTEWMGGEGASTLRLSLPEGEHALVVEALDPENASDPTILGVGSAVVRVE